MFITIAVTSLMVGIFNSVHPLIRNAQVEEEEESTDVLSTPAKTAVQQGKQKQLPTIKAVSESLQYS